MEAACLNHKLLSMVLNFKAQCRGVQGFTLVPSPLWSVDSRSSTFPWDVGCSFRAEAGLRVWAQNQQLLNQALFWELPWLIIRAMIRSLSSRSWAGARDVMCCLFLEVVQTFNTLFWNLDIKCNVLLKCCWDMQHHPVLCWILTGFKRTLF